MVAVAALVVGCGSDHSSGHGSADEKAPSGSTATGALSDREVEFAQGMIAHHAQAIEMADTALDPARGASTEVMDLARRVKAAQDPEIALMMGWLGMSGDSMDMDSMDGHHTDGHDMESMEGMMSDEQMESMSKATGADFDRLWLELMILHHRGAVAESEQVKADGSNADVQALADQIIAAQQAEIAEMEALLP